MGDDVTVAGTGVVARDVRDGETVAGFPARPLREFLKSQALVRRIPKLEERLRALERAMQDAEKEAP
jgi:UDP-3-O-[3-hydroxymyristoyl] glucosamine N-acyltransferase